ALFCRPPACCSSWCRSLLAVPADASNLESVVVSVLNVTAKAGSRTHLTTKGRISMTENAFVGAQPLIWDLAESDQGIYSCSLHHHYCHLYETVQVQLTVTKRQVQKYWDGEKPVIVALKGSTVVLPCINRNQVWTERHDEEEQQVVHWDRQPPGVPHDRADRLIDLYASGEGRSYGPLFMRQKMNITEKAFALGDFSLRISGLEVADEGTYSCHLHHHYCGLHERRIFQVSVVEPEPERKVVVNITHSSPPVADPNAGHSHNVINVIIPDTRAHFFHQLSYILPMLLLFILLLILVVLIAHKHRRRGFEYNVKKYDEKDIHLRDFPVDTTDLSNYKNEDIRLDYKNNILKEKSEQNRVLPAKNIDLDKAFYCYHS
uniref:Matrix remodeling-associated protein 8 n=1 Tax=Anolis carolinensis TaxID=28377 RepID=H9GEP6_ANOCA